MYPNALIHNIKKLLGTRVVRKVLVNVFNSYPFENFFMLTIGVVYGILTCYSPLSYMLSLVCQNSFLVSTYFFRAQHFNILFNITNLVLKLLGVLLRSEKPKHPTPNLKFLLKHLDQDILANHQFRTWGWQPWLEHDENIL
jgi:hypothetical protein